MNGDAVRALIARRGSVVQWAHALPVPAALINPLTQGPRSAGLSGIGSATVVVNPEAVIVGESEVGEEIGSSYLISEVPGNNPGAMGEVYAPFVPIRAYFTNKTSSTFSQAFGLVESGDAQLDVAVPFEPDLDACIYGLPGALLTAYNKGQFAIIRNQTTATFDRFIIDGQPWIGKAVPVPLVDSNETFAYRILICKETY